MDSWLGLLINARDGGPTSARPALPVPAGDVEAEYRALCDGCAVVDRSNRSTLVLTGGDKTNWLHNLTTNHVKTLAAGDGNHAYACNAQGRILFDLNVLVRQEAIVVDVDAGVLELAKAHFEKYKIVEDVTVSDCGESLARLGLSGADVSAGLGVPQSQNLPQLGTAVVRLGDLDVPLVRTDFCGPFGVELFLPTGVIEEVWEGLAGGKFGRAFTPTGDAAVQVRRIEAGIPQAGREITDEYLPAEVGRLETSVSFNKGCYLGQEVIERMRSRGVVARRLVGVRITGDEVPPAGTTLANDGHPVGSMTSSCRSIALGSIVGLGYVKTSSASVGAALTVSWGDKTAEAVVTALPFVGSKVH